MLVFVAMSLHLWFPVFRPFWVNTLLVFFDLFWDNLGIFMFQASVFMYHNHFIPYLEYWYCICVFFSFDLFRYHYFYIFSHFYQAFFLWREELTPRKRIFFAIRWLSGISPAFYCGALCVIFAHIFSCVFFTVLVLSYILVWNYVNLELRLLLKNIIWIRSNFILSTSLLMLFCLLSAFYPFIGFFYILFENL